MVIGPSSSIGIFLRAQLAATGGLETDMAYTVEEFNIDGSAVCAVLQPCAAAMLIPWNRLSPLS
jgi:hypothetical protein